jgi:UDP-hydrolysing UDP-N-acetyl-D-glucosamine 2-epimerase
MKKNIVIISGSRADYYLLSNLKSELKKSANLNINFLITGGATKIRNQTSKKKIQIRIYKDKKITTPKAISEIVNKLSDYFNDKKIDLIILLGDRYEILGAAIAAHSFGIKIAHFHGGETTLGSKDDDYRNSITQFSNYHFVTCDQHNKRVKAIKNSSSNIYTTGSLGVDIIKKVKLLKKKQIEQKLNIKLREKISVVTVHPETKNKKDNLDIDNLFKAIEVYPNIDFIFTYPGYDFGFRKIINKIIQNKKKSNIYVFENLGQKLYYSLINISTFVMGNSSSGIIEVPSFKKYTINLGLRQKGRVHAKSVLHADFKKNEIKKQIKKVIMSNYFTKKFKNPHEKPSSLRNSARIIKNILNEK